LAGLLPEFDRSAGYGNIDVFATCLWPSPQPCAVAKLNHDCRKVLHGGDAHEPLLDIAPRAEDAAVPIGHLAKKETAPPFAAVGHEQVKMTRQKC
jgi:hypothetical protein